MLWGPNEFDDAVIIKNPRASEAIFLAAFERHLRNAETLTPKEPKNREQLPLPLEKMLNPKPNVL